MGHKEAYEGMGMMKLKQEAATKQSTKQSSPHQHNRDSILLRESCATEMTNKHTNDEHAQGHEVDFLGWIHSGRG